MRIQRAFVDSPDTWEDIDFDCAIEKLEGYYREPEKTLIDAKELRTPWAFYRIVEE